jgi:hypothetical protein
LGEGESHRAESDGKACDQAIGEELQVHGRAVAAVGTRIPNDNMAARAG